MFRRYLYFAQRADVEGYNDVAAVFRSTAEGETGHAHGHLEFLQEVSSFCPSHLNVYSYKKLQVGDPCTNQPMGNTVENLNSAIVGETHEYTEMYPSMVRTYLV